MRLEKFLLYLSLFTLLVAGFGLINLVVFLEIKRLIEENSYRLAYQHFLTHLQNPHHIGDKDFVINPPAVEGYRIYVFEAPENPLKSVRVGIREEFLRERKDSIMKRLLVAEFFLIFMLVFLYQRIIEEYFSRLKGKEEWIKSLMLSLTHRLGNFIATQKVLLAMLKKSYPQDEKIKRLEKSLQKVQRELSLFINPVKEGRENKRENIQLEDLIRETLSFFEEELKAKRLILRTERLFVYMNKEDLEDVLYNLIGNAIRHSRELIHIKVCAKKGLLVIRNDLGGEVKHGMGLGVELTRMVLKRYNFGLRISLKRHYTAFVLFKRQG